MSISRRVTDRPPSGGLRARLRGRLHGRAERGSVMVEALIFMFVISLTVGAYTTSNLTMNKVQRNQTAIDIVAQHAQGVLEKAKATPWADLAFRTADPGYRTAGVDNRPTVSTSAAASSASPLKPLETFYISGHVHVTQRVDVTWAAPTAATAATSASSFGEKQVTITMTFTVLGETATHTEIYHLTRTAAPSETVPFTSAGIPAAKVYEAAPAPTLQAPSSCPASYSMNYNSGGYWNLWWTPVSGATHYLYSTPAGSGDFPEGKKTTVSGGVTYNVLQVFNSSIGGGDLTITPANDAGAKTCPSQKIQTTP